MKAAMKNYAIDEFWTLLNQQNPSDQTLTYLCSLVAELAYYHVPDAEIDQARRARIWVPSKAFRHIVAAGQAVNAGGAFTGEDFRIAFVAESYRSIAVGLYAGSRLFVGFRGTAALFDWRINLKARLVPISLPCRQFFLTHTGRLHRGFTEESIRISLKIEREIQNLAGIKEIYFSGHSLGGAVAAISAEILGAKSFEPVRIFGSPRYADINYYFSTGLQPPLQFVRSGDIVPSMPPRILGYADHPSEWHTAGHPLPEAERNQCFLRRAIRFSRMGREPHDIEGYRHELGHSCQAMFAAEPLTNLSKLGARDFFVN